MNLLGRAREAWKGFSPPPPPEHQEYNIACPHGHRLRGHRAEGYQALRCPVCGEGVFVLPRSPLPLPSRPIRKETAERASGRMAVEVWPPPEEDSPIELRDPIGAELVPNRDDGELEIEWLEPEPSAPEPKPVPAPRPLPDDGIPVARPAPKAAPSPPAARKPVEKPRPKPVAPKAFVREEPEDEPSPAPPRRARRPIPRHYLALAGVIVVVALTILVRVSRDRRADFPRIAELGRTEGLAALDAGDFDTAKRLLAEAARAVEALGDDVQDAAAIRQGAAEASLFVDLTARTLEEILVEADPDPQGPWPARFKTHYRDQSVIVEAYVVKAPTEGGNEGYDLDYRVLVGRGPKPVRVARIDTTGFELFEQTKPTVGTRVTFGARLAAVEPEERGGWRIALRPDSGVYITHESALRTLGWPIPEAAPDPESGDEQP